MCEKEGEYDGILKKKSVFFTCGEKVRNNVRHFAQETW